jgi:type I restriction enzyme S subunit
LRFPEFSGEWEKTTIGNCCSEFQSGKNIKAADITLVGKYPVYGGNGLRGYSTYYNHDGNYVLIGRQGALCGNVRFVTGKNYITEHAIAVQASNGCDTKFLLYLFEKMKLGQYSDQSAQPGLAVNKLVKLKVNIPSLCEQSKLAELLTLLDERIATQRKVIEKLQSLIGGIIHRVSCDGLKNGTWRMTMLSSVLSERIELNTEQYQVHSVSVTQGVINQVEYLGRSFAAKDTSNYHVVKYGDIVYTKSPTGDFPYGIIKQSYINDNVAVSPLYGVYKPNSIALGMILHHYFLSPVNAQNYLHKLIQKGAKNTINITNQRFLENSIPLPMKSIDIEKLATLLQLYDAKLTMENNLLSALHRQKMYLLSTMFI